MKKGIALLALMMTQAVAWGATDRVLDGKYITNGGATITIPTTTTNLVGDNTTQTLSNKTLTAPVISGGVTGVTKSDVGLGNVDNTSDATKNAATATLTNKTIDGASNTLSNIPAATALTGQVPVANGGTGASTQAGAANAVLPSQSSNSGKYLTTDGTNVSWASVPATAPSVTGSRASPTAITAGGGISFSGSAYGNIAFIQGSGGPVSVSANPQIAAGTAVGQILHLISRSGTNTVTLADGNGLSLNGPWVGGLDSVLNLIWDGTSWVEESRR